MKTKKHDSFVEKIRTYFYLNDKTAIGSQAFVSQKEKKQIKDRVVLNSDCKFKFSSFYSMALLIHPAITHFNDNNHQVKRKI